MRHGQRTEMKYPALLHRALRDLLFRQHHVCTGIAIKREIPVPVGEFLHKGQRCAHIRITYQTARTYSRFPNDRTEQIPEHVCPHLPDKKTVPAQLFQHSQHIAGRSARVGLKQGVALSAKATFSEINQQLPQSHYVKSLFRYHAACSSQFEIKLYRFAADIAKFLMYTV